MTTLAERLGYGPDDRLLVVSCAELGVFHARHVGDLDGARPVGAGGGGAIPG